MPEIKKGKGRVLATALVTWVRFATRSADNLGSGSWLAWANDTAAHYAAIHCPCQWTNGPVVCSQQIYHRKLLLISRPAEGRRL